MPIDKKTKIIATIGPAAETTTAIKKMIRAGVNVFRFNMKHGTVAWHQMTIRKVQQVADALDIPIGILIDLQGPEIRIKTSDDLDIHIKKGDSIDFSLEFEKSTDLVKVPQETFFEALEKGDRFSIDDGFIRWEVVSCSRKQHRLTARTLDSGILKTNKSLNLVGKDIDLPSLIKEDIERLSVATKEKVDFVALSFSRTRQDIEALRKVMKRRGIAAHIVAKIESQKALDNIDDIIDASDVVMIARGDLGVEVPIEQITFHQKEIIRKCRCAYKPVIVATQMLQSMIENPLPTRAEATDVSNAVFDGTDCVMLSGETATGKYPIRSVEAMSAIVAFNETKAAVEEFDLKPNGPTEIIVSAAHKIAETADTLDISKILVFTETGHTARVLSSFRPDIPIIVVTDNQKTVETTTISYGISSVKVRFPSSGKMLSPETVLERLKEKKMVKRGDNVLMIHGQHWRKPGQTNAVVLLSVD